MHVVELQIPVDEMSKRRIHGTYKFLSIQELGYSFHLLPGTYGGMKCCTVNMPNMYSADKLAEKLKALGHNVITYRLGEHPKVYHTKVYLDDGKGGLIDLNNPRWCRPWPHEK